jgi:hypothetical protein
MKSTKEMRDRARELSMPNRDDYDRAVVCIIDDLETAAYFKLPDGRVVSFNPCGRWHGWIWRIHPDGQMVSESKLEAFTPIVPEFLGGGK